MVHFGAFSGSTIPLFSGDGLELDSKWPTFSFQPVLGVCLLLSLKAKPLVTSCQLSFGFNPCLSTLASLCGLALESDPPAEIIGTRSACFRIETCLCTERINIELQSVSCGHRDWPQIQMRSSRLAYPVALRFRFKFVSSHRNRSNRLSAHVCEHWRAEPSWRNKGFHLNESLLRTPWLEQ